MIYADPSIASWRPYFPNLTYMAYMGISDARWNLASGGADEIVTPSQNQGLWPDQFWVARSLATAATLGEPQFTSSACVQVADANTTRLIDKTALAVDSGGRVWVAVEDRGQEHPEPGVGATGFIRLFRNEGPNLPEAAQFVEVPVPSDALPGLGNRDPVLRAYPDGQDSSLSSVLQPADTSSPARLRHLRWQAVAPSATMVGLDLSSGPCADAPLPRRDELAIGLGTDDRERLLRTGVRASHDMGFDGEDIVARFAYEHVAGGGAQVQVVEVFEDPSDPSIILCRAPDTWSTSTRYSLNPNDQAFQPQIDYHMRRLRPEYFDAMPAHRGIIPDQGLGSHLEWEVAWYGTLFSPDATEPYLQVTRATLAASNADSRGLISPATEWYDTPCPVPANDCWGDYFGLGQHWDHWTASWWNAAAYSSSDPAGEPDHDCFERSGQLASPLHIGASSWPSWAP